jgi:Carboxypeptidase regulatory-like domain
MKLRCGNRLAVSVMMALGLGLALPVASAQNDEGPTSSLRIVVVRDADGKPIKNAQVVLHSVNRKGKATRGEMELKTDADGRASADAIPYGALEVQVLAKGFQTFGEDYEVKQAEQEITVKLKRPSGQYSIYDNHDDKKPPEPKPQ